MSVNHFLRQARVSNNLEQRLIMLVGIIHFFTGVGEFPYLRFIGRRCFAAIKNIPRGCGRKTKYAGEIIDLAVSGGGIAYKELHVLA